MSSGVRLRGKAEIKQGCLLPCAGKSVQHEPIAAVGFVDSFDEHIHDQVIRHQPAFFHHRFYMATQLGVAANVLAQNFPRRDMRHPQLSGKHSALGALAGSRWSEDNQNNLP
jgi:hypothetical protein